MAARVSRTLTCTELVLLTYTTCPGHGPPSALKASSAVLADTALERVPRGALRSAERVEEHCSSGIGARPAAKACMDADRNLAEGVDDIVRERT